MLVSLVIFYLFTMGIMLLFDIDFTEEIKVEINKSLKSRIKDNVKVKKDNYIVKTNKEVRSMLITMNKERYYRLYVFISYSLATTGLFWSYIYNNYIIMLPITILMFTIPYIFILFMFYRNKEKVNNNLSVALSIITSSYLRNDNIIKSVEENIDNIGISKQVFIEFVNENKLIGTDTTTSLYNMKNKINNTFFYEWIDILVLCMQDSNMKKMLPSIIDKITENNMINSDIKYQVDKHIREFIAVVIFVVIGFIILITQFEVINDILTTTTIGKLLLTVNLVVVMFSILRAIKLVKEVEYL